VADLTLTVEPDEWQGLAALAEVRAAARGETADIAGTAEWLLHAALEARLEETGLSWAPAPEAVARKVKEAARPDGRLLALAKNQRARRYAISALAVAVLVTLWGGYAMNWQWTGFPGNSQLWDWLRLLLLPIVVGTIPLWLRHPDYVSSTRRTAYLALAAGIAGFVAAGYLVPLRWTGFAGNTLWDWLGLILLPAAIASARVLPIVLRSLRPAHRLGIAIAVLAWCVTIVGGYAWRWTWTGYAGNTLWDWLQLLLLPLIVPTILLPAALGWMASSAPASGRPGRVKTTAR
jgi:hypothetical protein